ncbi:MAG TPA: nitroreductase family protein [bacterium]|nr:nitroreductase family protein [bacterium]
MSIKPEDFVELAKGRRSSRAMSPEPIPREHLDAIVECGLFAPSGSNQQPWHFAVVTDRKLINKMKDAAVAKVELIKDRISSASAQRSFDGYIQYITFFDNSSAVICCFVEPYRALLERLLSRYAPEISVSTRENASVQSVAAAVENMLLAAHAFGYAACWMTGPLIAKEDIEKLVKPEGNWDLLAIVALGQRLGGKDAPQAPKRRPREETVSFFGE